MYVHQISVFIENKAGRLADLTAFLADNNVNLRALEIADSTDYGIIRLIVDEPFNTLTLLKDNDYVCKLTHMLGVKLADKPGAMSQIMKIVADAGVSVEYLYAFLGKSNNQALMVMKVQDNDQVAAILKRNGINILSQEDLETV